MIPPLMSSTLSGDDILGKKDQGTTTKNQNTAGKVAAASPGRPAKEESAKSDKTLKNQESMN
jgi:hypothetical protein